MNEGNAPAQQPFQSASFDRKIVAVVVAVAALAIGAYIINFSHNQMGPPESWGQFGDYLGGIVNPAVGIVTVLLVAQTLAATRQEAADTRAEMKIQTDQFKEQLAMSKQELAAADVRRQLEAILEEWRRRVLAWHYKGPLGWSPKKGVILGDGETLETIFEERNNVRFIKMARNSSNDTLYIAALEENFGVAAQLIEELALACDRYDELVKTRAYTDFFRRRAAGALGVIEAAGFISKAAADILRIKPLAPVTQFVDC